MDGGAAGALVIRAPEVLLTWVAATVLGHAVTIAGF